MPLQSQLYLRQWFYLFLLLGHGTYLGPTFNPTFDGEWAGRAGSVIATTRVSDPLAKDLQSNVDTNLLKDLIAHLISKEAESFIRTLDASGHACVCPYL